MSAVLLDDRIVHYEVLGRGRPVIFLHGWVGSWRYWIPAMQTAAMSFRAYALDQWGFGDTAHEPARYTLDQQTVLLEHFMQEMGIAKVALIGHGLGGLIALQFLQRFPALVDRVMTVNVPFDIRAVHSRLRSATTPADLADWLLGRNESGESARVDAIKTDPQAIPMSLNGLAEASFPSAMDVMLTPCLIVHGEDDPAIQTPDYERVMAMPERVHQVVLEGSGHFPMLDQSARFNRLMADFLALESGDSPRQLQLKEEWKRRVR